MKIKNFPPNSRITFLSSVFKEHKNNDWKINIGLENYQYLNESQRYLFKHARFSNMPLLANNRRFNQTKKTKLFDSNESTITIKIDNFHNWEVRTRKSGQYQFSHVVSDIHGKHTNIQILLPQIELARVLFFNTAYLSRAALDQHCLHREFDIIRTESQTIINLPDVVCRFPTYQLDNTGMRRLLAWILLDIEARSSFESISKHLITNKYSTKKLEFWTFTFSPPSLKGAEITMKVYFSEKYQQYYVNEILAISNLPSDIRHEVIFCSNKFKVKSAQQISAESSIGSKPHNADPTIDDDKEPNSDKPTTTIDSPKISMSLANPFETKKAVIKSIGKKGTFNSEDISILPDPSVGTGESSTFGEIGRGEFANVQDESDDLELFMGRFEGFKAMIEQFTLEHNIQPIINILRLPAVNRSKLHLTYDGNSRCIVEVKFKLQGKQFVILEIDTTDNHKPLSTLIIKIENLEVWDEYFPVLQRQVVKRSLRWPTAKLLDGIGVRKTFNHPRNKNEMTETDKEFRGWMKRFESILNSI